MDTQLNMNEDKQEEYVEYVFSRGNKIGTIIWILVYLVVIAVLIATFFTLVAKVSLGFLPLAIICSIIFLFSSLFILFSSFVIISPNEAIVMTFCGKYMGSLKEDGCHFKNPFYSCTRISTKTLAIESDTSKVNDSEGNPIICSATVVYKVNDSCKACFAVENYNSFLRLQIDTSLRKIIHSYPYDTNEPETVCLKGGSETINTELTEEIQKSVEVSGLTIISSRLSNLSYSPEIAGVMLKKQQAIALLQAREKIVKGAVSMIKNTIEDIATEGIVELNDDYKQKIVSQLLVVMVSESGVSPVMNT